MSGFTMSWMQLVLQFMGMVITVSFTVFMAWHNLKNDLTRISGEFNERISVLSARVDGLSGDVTNLQEAQRATDVAVNDLSRQISELSGRVGELSGQQKAQAMRMK